MRVAVLGSSGGMGSFLVRYFLSKGHEVSGYDVRKPRNLPRDKRFRFYPSNAKAVRGTGLAVIATPMESTLDTAREVAPSLSPGSTLMEITSVKEKVTPALTRILEGRGVTLLSVHPLFGPALESTRGMKIAVITREERAARPREVALAKKIFPEARIIGMSLETHDRTMAVVLSLTHLLNLVYARTVSHYLSPEEFMRSSTPNSSMQLTLAEAVLAQDPTLCYNIQIANSNSKRVAATASEELQRLSAILAKGDHRQFEEYFKSLANAFRTSSRGSSAIREVYSKTSESRA